MKKMVKIALAITLVGAALFTCGRAAGGELYSSYYNGKLHSIRSTLDDIADGARNSLRWRDWDDDDEWWETSRFARRSSLDTYIRDEISDAWDDAWDDAEYAIDDALDEIDSEFETFGKYADDVLVALDKTERDSIRELDIHLRSGNFVIKTGDTFAFISDYPFDMYMDTDNVVPGNGSYFARSKADNGRWTFVADCTESTDDVDAVITLPPRTEFDRVWLSIGDSNVNIDTTLKAQELNVTMSGQSEFEAEFLDTQDGDFSASEGSEFSAELAGRENDYTFKCKASQGGLLELNDHMILQSPRSTGESTSNDIYDGKRILNLNAVNSEIELETKH